MRGKGKKPKAEPISTVRRIKNRILPLIDSIIADDKEGKEIVYKGYAAAVIRSENPPSPVCPICKDRIINNKCNCPY